MSSEHLLVRLESLGVIGIGGFAGSNLRLFTLGGLSELQAVLLVNALGSLVLGFLIYEAAYSGVIDRTSSLLFTTGFLSSLTTYSTFALQTATAEQPTLLVGLIAGNYGLGFVGVLVGRSLARRVRGDGT